VAQSLSVSGFWNPSRQSGALDRCLGAVKAAGSLRDARIAFVVHCTPLTGGLLDGSDLAESASQILRHFVPQVALPRQISLELADTLQAYRDIGKHAMVIGHSQGMLLAREAAQELLASDRYRQTRDSTCLAGIGMGGPSSGAWGLPPNQVHEYATSGDLVATLSGAGQPKIATQLSIELAAANTGALPLAAFVNTIVYGIRLHALGETYLVDPTAVATLLNRVELLRRECEPGTVTSVFTTPPPFYRGSELFAPSYFLINSFNGRRLYGRTMQITSTDSAVVTVLPNRMIWGVAHGTAIVVGRVATATGEMPLTVGPVPVVLSGGTRSGTWRINTPLTQDSLYLSGAIQVDSIAGNGDYLVSGGTVTYRYQGTMHTVPMLGAVIAPGGIRPTLRFNMATPEFPNPGSYAMVQLEIWPDGRLMGGAILYYLSGLVRESRGWDLGAPIP
jgi:hypothetical protein